MEWYTISYQKRLFAYLLLGGILPLLIVSTIILYAADRAYESTQEKAGTLRCSASPVRSTISHLLISG